MGATSATGVGAGAANVVRGPGNNRNQYQSLLDPHIVAHGTVFVEAGTGGEWNIDLPSNVWDKPENLMILVAGKSLAIYKNTNGDGLVTSFTIDGAKKRDVDYVVIKSPSGLFVPGDYD